jgi:hypothetical protein
MLVIIGVWEQLIAGVDVLSLLIDMMMNRELKKYRLEK